MNVRTEDGTWLGDNFYLDGADFRHDGKRYTIITVHYWGTMDIPGSCTVKEY